MIVTLPFGLLSRTITYEEMDMEMNSFEPLCPLLLLVVVWLEL
jgi:hypothetical protein